MDSNDLEEEILDHWLVKLFNWADTVRCQKILLLFLALVFIYFFSRCNY